MKEFNHRFTCKKCGGVDKIYVWESNKFTIGEYLEVICIGCNHKIYMKCKDGKI